MSRAAKDSAELHALPTRAATGAASTSPRISALEKRGVRYIVRVYRKLSRNEVVGAIRDARSGMRRKPKRGETLTIETVLD